MEDGLVRFLLARISDDEKTIRKHAKAGELGGIFPVNRLLAECATKRELVGVMQRMFVLRDLPIEQPVRDGAGEALKRLAALYDAHKSYRSEWRPKTGGIPT